MDLFKSIELRRSIRRYKNKEVSLSDLKRILEAARLAPSASNRQEWRFVVVRDPEKRSRLAAAAANQAFVAEAPLVIACCSVDDQKIMRCGHPAYAIDLAIAIEHMVLAATALGIGTCWIGAFYEDQVRAILEIPERVRVVELLTLGHADENPEARPRLSMEQIVCDETWKWQGTG